MFKKYLDFFADIFVENHREATKIDYWIYDSTDKILVWIVSLSTASIALLISNGDKLKVDKPIIDVTLIFLLGSIITGIIGRVISFEASRLYKKVMEIFEFDMRLTQMQYFPHTITEKDTTATIYFRIKDDFDFDLESYVGVKSLEEFSTRFNYDKAKELYESVYKYCKASKDRALDEVNVIINKTLGREKIYKPTERDIKRTSEKTAKLVLNISKVFNAFCITCFIAAILVITLANINF